ncbi:class I SAM-dependent rRNA methyltransferase [Rhizobiales bacterium]|uniref:class I SAM-dependent methyltransferase n=1 Tax=Hongsoonwoonella zoysiae TaxID=2821844 RepID=UPI0015610185|nr:class I SAM-dependent methyltransferase [Hongsoonwoonella zoysiae]NRG16182.1 class I SAM-dependent rRNA methyltransferase [Hongsoonwoonella zoysiae]
MRSEPELTVLFRSSALPAPAPRGKAPAECWPVVLETRGWEDYSLIDMGHGRKMERYGRVTVVRPEPQAMGTPRLKEAAWEGVDAVFTGDVEEEGPGRWRFNRDLPETWEMAFGPARFHGRFMSFRHVGVFPEQAAHWEWIVDQVKAAKRPLKVLNLFGYTGLASLLPATAGAEVTHIDASKKAIGWARENQALSGIDDLPIRWICEDASKFVAREIRRGNTYDGIILDPPKYGRGPKGEVWDLFTNLPGMLYDLEKLLSPEARFMILTAYAIRSSFVAIHEVMNEALNRRGGLIESGELVIREERGREGRPARALSTSLFSRWSAP